jgi:hypothetical protein
MYSFCNNPIEAATSGVSSGGHRFYGSEQLQIKFDTATTSALNIMPAVPPYGVSSIVFL